MMTLLERRAFLSRLSIAFSGAVVPLAVRPESVAGQDKTAGTCWLDVCAPFVVDDADLGIRSEIILTSDTFVGPTGHADALDQTEYEICLYRADGTAIGEDGVAKKLTVPAMHNTMLPVRELVGDKPFFGGLTVRLRPGTRTPMHASDLFSSAFVRWSTEHSFDNVHANPDPIVWQRATPFFYSMPFPPLAEYECLYSIYNPYEKRSRGNVTLYDPLGKTLRKLKLDLKPHSSLLLDLRRGEFVANPGSALRMNEQATPAAALLTREGGTLAITNDGDSVKNFGFMMMRRSGTRRLSIEHPIHQSPYDPVPTRPPFDAEGRFKAKNILFTPLVFNARKIGGVTLDARFHISSGAPIEECLWTAPFITDSEGGVPWEMMNDEKTAAALPSKQVEQRAIKLGGQQSCILDASRLGLPSDFSGGLSLPISPTSNHTLMKVELTAIEWGAYAFTHFRPGLAAARNYQKPSQRGGLATDYIVSGAKLIRSKGAITWDEIVCVINIDDKGVVGRPTLELFTDKGLVSRIPLGNLPPFACRHYLLSEVAPAKLNANELTMRLVDDRAVILMSVVHLNYTLRDIAIDHGSDRFSTFNEFTCKVDRA